MIIRQNTTNPTTCGDAGRTATESRARSESGQALVEFALVMPILFLVIFGIIDFGLGFSAWNTSQNAAREAARVAAVDPNAATIVARARATSSLLNQANFSVLLTCSSDNGTTFTPCPIAANWGEGDIVRVKVSYAYRYVTPLPRLVGLGGTMAQTATAEARFEGQ
jgi:Flp pilus assembly protein TadG